MFGIQNNMHLFCSMGLWYAQARRQVQHSMLIGVCLVVLQVDQELLSNGKKLLQVNSRGASSFENVGSRSGSATVDNIQRAVNGGASLSATRATTGAASRLTNLVSRGPASTTVSRLGCCYRGGVFL